MTQNQEYLAAIENRKSRRTYTTEPIAQEKTDYLNSLIEKFNKEGSLSIAWIPDGEKAFTTLKSYGMFKNVKSVIVLKGKHTTEDLYERIGHYGELLVLEATKLGLGTCWIAGTYDKKSNLFPLGEEEELVSLISIGNVLEERSFKEKLIYRTVRRKSRPLETFYTAEGKVPQWFIKGIEAVAKAPSAVNSQRVRFHYSKSGVTASVPKSWATDPIDLGIAKLHFALATGGKFSFGEQAVFERQ
jgi:nitroreductase